MALKIWLWLKTDPWICWSSSVLDASWICTAAQNASSCWMAGANSETGIWHAQSFWLSAACSKYRPQHSATGNVSLQDAKPHKLWSYWKKKCISYNSRSSCKVLRCDISSWLIWLRQAEERPEMLSWFLELLHKEQAEWQPASKAK